MHLNIYLGAIVASCSFLASAAILRELEVPSWRLMNNNRLVKTSQNHPGTWLENATIQVDFFGQNLDFVDITEIRDKDVLDVLSGRKKSSEIRNRPVKYPEALTNIALGKALIENIKIGRQKVLLKHMMKFSTRNFETLTGREATDWLLVELQEFAGFNQDVQLYRVSHRWPMPSIIARIPGHSNDTVIVGAHFDSTASYFLLPAPGADDNGSGTVTVLEAFRVFAKHGFKPKNTLEFHFYSAGKGGLLGSQAIFNYYKESGKVVLAMLNLDQVGYSSPLKVGVSPAPVIYTDFTDPALNIFLRQIILAYTGQSAGISSCGFGCSDHVSATSNGFPAARVGGDTTSGLSPYTHTIEDEYETISWNKIQTHIELTLGFLTEASFL